MNLFDQLKHRLGGRTQIVQEKRPELDALRQALDAGQRAKRAENYPLALEALQHAMRLAITAGDTTAIAVIVLNQAEVYIGQQRWDEAASLLDEMLVKAQQNHQRPQMAYLFNALGMLAQAQADWPEATRRYEQAQEMARLSHSTGAEGRALGFLADTYLHDHNASYAVHLLRDSLPRLNMTGDIELSSYFVGRLGQALFDTGHESEGRQLLDRALRLARQMGYRKYERLWALTLADLALKDGRSEEAQAHLQAALALFGQAAPTDDFIRALCKMVKVSLMLHDVPAALQHAQQAADLGIGTHDDAVAMDARAAMGMALSANHEYASAIPHLEAALTALESVPDEAFSSVELQRALAVAWAETGDLERAAAIYRRAAERAAAADHKLDQAAALRDLGLLYAKRRNMHDAQREWSAALVLYDGLRQSAQASRLYCDLAAVRKYLGMGQRAIKDIEEALMLLSNLHEDWETRGLVLSNAAVAYVDQGDHESAESFFNESIAIARRLGDEAAEAVRRGNYGWYLLATGKPQQALSTLEHALRLSQQHGLRLAAAVQTDNIGLAHDALTEYSKAEAQHRAALEHIAPLHEPHWERLIQANLAATLLAQGDREQAARLYSAVRESARAEEDAEALVRALIGLAQGHIRGGQPAAAPPLLDEATQITRRGDMRLLSADVLSARSEQQAALGNPAQAAADWNEAKRLYTMLHAPQGRIQPAWLSNSETG
jgi:tetratricopeptide (TPR) repeat protein